MNLAFEYNNQIEILPVNPESVEISRNTNNNTVEIVELGEINQIGSSRLARIRIESFFPTNSNQVFVKKENFRAPEFYANFFRRMMQDRRPCRFLITNTNLNILATVEVFDTELKGAEGDIYFVLVLREYKPHQAREVRINITPPTPARPNPPPPRVVTPPPRPPAVNRAVTIGATVIVNGRLHRDSFGTGPGQTEREARRRVNFMAPGRSHPYHVTNMEGGWRGWVTANSVRVV